MLAANEIPRLGADVGLKDRFADASARLAAQLLDCHGSSFDTGIIENPFYASLQLRSLSPAGCRIGSNVSGDEMG